MARARVEISQSFVDNLYADRPRKSREFVPFTADFDLRGGSWGGRLTHGSVVCDTAGVTVELISGGLGPGRSAQYRITVPPFGMARGDTLELTTPGNDMDLDVLLSDNRGYQERPVPEVVP